MGEMKLDGLGSVGQFFPSMWTCWALSVYYDLFTHVFGAPNGSAFTSVFTRRAEY